MDILKGIQFLYGAYNKIEGDSKKREFLRNIIRNEARLNNDIANIIYKTGPKNVAIEMPELFEQLDTSSFDLLSALGIPPCNVFDEKKEPTFEELEKLGRSGNDIDNYKNKSQVELYEFYIRKSKLLASLSRSDSISQAKVGLKARVGNIKNATYFLSKKLKIN